jgi:hypothetical protein
MLDVLRYFDTTWKRLIGANGKIIEMTPPALAPGLLIGDVGCLSHPICTVSRRGQDGKFRAVRQYLSMTVGLKRDDPRPPAYVDYPFEASPERL